MKKNTYFASTFSSALKRWMDLTGKTQEEFAELVGVASPNSVTNWKNGQFPSKKFLDKICEVLGVDERYFYPTTQDDQYKYSSDYMNGLGEDEITPFCEEVGLDTQFLRVIRKLLGSDFDSMFPTWTELYKNPNFFSDETYIRRSPEIWSESAEMKEEYRIFQREIEFEEDGKKHRKLILLSRPDILFLKDVQTEVMDYIEFRMMKRARDLKREAEEASRRSQHRMKSGGIGFKPLTVDELNQIDKYHDYHYTYHKQREGKDNGKHHRTEE